MINRTIYEYWKILEPMGYHVFEQPFKFTAATSLDVSHSNADSGIADSETVQVRLDVEPSFWSASGQSTIVGHELAHCFIARALSQPHYSWGGQIGHDAVNFVHCVDGLEQFKNDGRYIKRKKVFGSPLNGFLYIPITYYDIPLMFENRSEIERVIFEHRANPAWRLV